MWHMHDELQDFPDETQQGACCGLQQAPCIKALIIRH